VTGVPEWFFLLFLGLFGLLFGSFANVVIWRVPRGESIVSPGSHCPNCGMDIRWYDNVPVVSYILLRARCRGCGTGISPRYPIFELASGALWVVAGLTFGVSPRTVAAIFLFYLLLLLAVIDLDTQRLPNLLVAVLAGGGVVGLVVTQMAQLQCTPLIGIADSGLAASPWAAAAIGVMLGAGIPGIIGLAYSLVRGKQGMGMGDIKLLGALGLYTGPYVVMVLLVASILGAAVGFLGSRDVRTSEQKIPFGPFLAAATLIVVTAGPTMWTWYAAVTGIA